MDGSSIGRMLGRVVGASLVAMALAAPPAHAALLRFVQLPAGPAAEAEALQVDLVLDLQAGEEPWAFDITIVFDPTLLAALDVDGAEWWSQPGRLRVASSGHHVRGAGAPTVQLARLHFDATGLAAATPLTAQALVLADRAGRALQAAADPAQVDVQLQGQARPSPLLPPAIEPPPPRTPPVVPIVEPPFLDVPSLDGALAQEVAEPPLAALLTAAALGWLLARRRRPAASRS